MEPRAVLYDCLYGCSLEFCLYAVRVRNGQLAELLSVPHRAAAVDAICHAPTTTNPPHRSPWASHVTQSFVLAVSKSSLEHRFHMATTQQIPPDLTPAIPAPATLLWTRVVATSVSWPWITKRATRLSGFFSKTGESKLNNSIFWRKKCNTKL
jgi:hypothetical protein